MKTGAGVLLAAMAALACTTLTTSVDYDRSLDFSRYRSFSFQKGTPTRRDFTQKRIEEVIGAALQAKGLTPARGEKPDLHVFTHVVVEVGGSRRSCGGTAAAGAAGLRRPWYPTSPSAR